MPLPPTTTQFPRSTRKNMTNITETAAPPAHATEAPAKQPAGSESSAGNAAAKPGRGSGRKLRTPFRSEERRVGKEGRGRRKLERCKDNKTENNSNTSQHTRQ